VILPLPEVPGTATELIRIIVCCSVIYKEVDIHNSLLRHKSAREKHRENKHNQSIKVTGKQI